MAKKKTEEKIEIAEVVKTPVLYTKAQIYKAKRYMNRKDIITVMLEDDKRYTFDQVDKLIEQFLKGGK